VSRRRKLAPPFVVPWTAFPFDVAVFLGHEREEVIAWLEKRLRAPLTDEERSAVDMPGVGRTAMIADGVTVIRVLDPNDSSIIAHEALHAVALLFETIGVTNTDNEITAYLLGYLVEQIERGKRVKPASPAARRLR